MSQLSLLPAHRNQQLFADHYLDQILPERPEWAQVEAEATAAFHAIKAIYERYVPSDNEAQLERDVIRPVLDALGHTYEIQAALRTPDGTKQPDYVFYRDEAARHANRNLPLTDELLRPGGIAVGDAKAWDRALDMAIRTERQRGDVFTNRNPSSQIEFYIRHSGLDWGILTNGRLWRLYHRESAHKLDRFYEVDLVALLDGGDPARFLYFYAFFRRAAFDPHGLSLDSILHGSREYARAVSDSIKQQVYDALEQLAQGFLDYPRNNLQPDPQTLKQIYDNSLIVLYRLLFILYAEARDLLPLRESDAYRREYSLDAIKRVAATNIDQATALLPTSARFWQQLRDLFDIIDRGSPPLHVATFNGGLFDPQRHPFLEQHSVGDARLQRAIDLLARVDKQFVDYRDLAERHLGTIYEGLLEHHLAPLAPSLRATPLPTGGRGAGGEGLAIQLRNDRGERKATGSYYTPDYIVKYIVDQTVGPVLRRAVEGKTDDAARIRAVLNVNVLDPAMGSGHFLVEATDYIARFLVDLNVQPTEDTGGEADVAYWRRRVVQSCIYGVDLNPLAVDLAKLSLWLATVAKDRPLSFLDHHLRCGNALVGAKLADLHVGSGGAGAARKSRKKAASDAQLPMFSETELAQTMTTAVSSMWLIEDNPAATVADVKQQEQIYRDLRAGLMGKYGRLADLVTATYFGVEVDPTLWNALADYATGRTPIALPRIPALLDEAARIAAERRFFHWELEFPEVFFDRNGQPLGDRAGFEAVIGNPPYGYRMIPSEQEKSYFGGKFRSHQNNYENYVYFTEQALNLVSQIGLQSFIIPHTYLSAVSMGAFRKFLLEQASVLEIFYLGLDVFENVTLEAVIQTAQKVQIDTPIEIKLLDKTKTRISLAYVTYNIPRTLFGNSAGGEFNINLSGKLGEVTRKLDLLSIQLEKIAYVTVGVNTGYIRDVLVSDKKEDDRYHPMISGRNISRYMIEWDGEWICYDSKLVDSYGDRGRTLPPEYIFSRPKILLQRTRRGLDVKLVATLDKSQFYNLNRLSNIVVNDDSKYKLEYLLSLLNSKLLDRYFNWVFNEYEVKPAHLRQLPIRRIAFTTPEDERARLHEKARRLYEQFCTKIDYECVLGFVDHHLPNLPDGAPDTAGERSDVIHDLLAFLAEHMIDLNRQRQAALDDLLLDLEGVLPTGALDSLNRLWTPPKAPAAPDDEAARVLGALAARRIDLRADIGAINEEQWKWLVRRRVKKLDSLADVVRVYRRRQPTIAALDHRIAATDRLIDRIVYRLYNLSPDEIAIVEGG